MRTCWAAASSRCGRSHLRDGTCPEEERFCALWSSTVLHAPRHTRCVCARARPCGKSPQDGNNEDGADEDAPVVVGGPLSKKRPGAFDGWSDEEEGEGPGRGKGGQDDIGDVEAVREALAGRAGGAAAGLAPAHAHAGHLPHVCVCVLGGAGRPFGTVAGRAAAGHGGEPRACGRVRGQAL